MPTQTRTLLRFLLLYSAMYSAFGVASPFFPELIQTRGMPTTLLGAVLAAGIVVRILSASLAGRIGDALHALRMVLVTCAALASAIVLAYLPAYGASSLFAVTLLHAAALAPLTVLADALALEAVRTGQFQYGWVRGAGSLTFVIGTMLTGHAISRYGLDAILWLQAALLAVTAVAASRVPEANTRVRDAASRPGVRALLRLPLFRRVIATAALVLGSHALHDSFAMIRWTAAGLSPMARSVLWSESVIAEVIVFFLVGPALLKRFRPALSLALAALAGLVRWSVAAQTTDVVALALVQPLHGFTFSLLHIACMQLLALIVPNGLEGTAQAIYGVVAVGGTTAIVTLFSGVLYGRFGGHAFWWMAAMCTLALVPAWLLREVRMPRLSRA